MERGRDPMVDQVLEETGNRHNLLGALERIHQELKRRRLAVTVGQAAMDNEAVMIETPPDR